MEDFMEIVFALIIVAIVTVVVVTMVASCTRDTDVKSQCLQAGYPRYDVANGEAYCIKYVDNTEIVVPLEQAIAGTKGE